MSIFTYVGTAGNDTFSKLSEGSKGTADGLGGFDTAVVNYSQSNFFVSTSTTGVVTLTTDSGGVLRFSNFEKIQFSGSTSIDLGSAGNDLVNGTAGVDTLYGLDGSDTLDGKAGGDKMLGGAGNDTYVVDSASDKVFETTTLTGTTDAGGSDLVKSAVNYTLGNFVEKLTLTGSLAINGSGNELSNSLAGNAAANTLTGAAGNDYLSGLAGNDNLLGGDGADKLAGGTGNDLLTGGTGVDIFLFNSTRNGTTNVDTIKDYDVGGVADKIQLDATYFNVGVAGTSAGTALPSTAFWAGTAAHDADDRIIYDRASGSLYYDADGNTAGGVAAVKFAIVGTTTHAALSAADFTIVP